jgi:hypothetical protein
MPTGKSLVQENQETRFRSKIVALILENRPELALKLLSEYYGVGPAVIRVGTVKGHRHALGCYVERERRIYVSKSEYLSSPFVVLHEFYHHLRASQISRNKQVEKRADLFASNYVEAFRRSHESVKLVRNNSDCAASDT